MEEGLKVAIWVAIVTAILGIITKFTELIMNWHFEIKRIKMEKDSKINNEIEKTYYEYIELLESFYLTTEEIINCNKYIWEKADELFNIEERYKERFKHRESLKKISMQLNFLKNKLIFNLGSGESISGKRAIEMLLASGELIEVITSRLSGSKSYDSYECLDNFICGTTDYMLRQKQNTDELTKLLIRYQIG